VQSLSVPSILERMVDTYFSFAALLLLRHKSAGDTETDDGPFVASGIGIAPSRA
jgi:hypothetical protein